MGVDEPALVLVNVPIGREKRDKTAKYVYQWIGEKSLIILTKIESRKMQYLNLPYAIAYDLFLGIRTY